MSSFSMLEFPVAEYEKRLQKFTARMRQEGMDAVILTTQENLRYFSGFRSVVWISKISKPGMLIITSEGEIVLIASESSGALGTARATSWIEEIRTFQHFNGGPCGVVADYLSEKGLAQGRIGMELGTGFRLHITHGDYVELMAALKGATIVDAAPAIWALREIKSELEIEKMRRVCTINIQAFEKTLNSIHEGRTELDLYHTFASESFRLGAESVLLMNIRAGEERYSQGNCPPSDRPIQKGEIVIIDGGPAYEGYFSDIIREAIIGKPSDRQRELFDFAVEACLTGLKAVKPGDPISEISKSIDRFVDQSRYRDIYATRGGCGHALGLDVHEPPLLKNNTDGLIKPGMILSIEPSFFEPGTGKFFNEENIAVTEGGYELLTPLDYDLWVLDA